MLPGPNLRKRSNRGFGVDGFPMLELFLSVFTFFLIFSLFLSWIVAPTMPCGVGSFSNPPTINPDDKDLRSVDGKVVHVCPPLPSSPPSPRSFLSPPRSRCRLCPRLFPHGPACASAGLPVHPQHGSLHPRGERGCVTAVRVQLEGPLYEVRLEDHEFLFSRRGVKLDRVVEMYQWVPKRKVRGKQEYGREWRAELVDSANHPRERALLFPLSVSSLPLLLACVCSFTPQTASLANLTPARFTLLPTCARDAPKLLASLTRRPSL